MVIGMEIPLTQQPGVNVEVPKPKRRVIRVALHGHHWSVYPMNTRGKDIYRVFHRVDGKRVSKTFMSLKDGQAHAKSLLREQHGNTESKIYLTDDEKRDWQAASNLMKLAGIRTSLESAIRHYCDLVKVVGHESLLTDVARKYAESRGKAGTPIKVDELRNAYLAALKQRGSSKRYVQTQGSDTGQFVKFSDGVMSDQVTREVMQDFIDSKKGCDARTKQNLLDSVEAMMKFGKSIRCVPPEWDEANQVNAPVEQPKKVRTYTAEELKKLLAATPKNFRPILALAAFAGIRSSELELLDWKHIRLLEKDPRDRLINLDVDVTEESSKRSIPITDILRDWIAGPYKHEGKFWTGSHDEFYRIQQAIAKDAGVVWQRNALRHTCISAKIAIFKDVPQVAYESGNSTYIIKKHYLNLMPPSAAEAWFGVTRLEVARYEETQQNASTTPEGGTG